MQEQQVFYNDIKNKLNNRRNRRRRRRRRRNTTTTTAAAKKDREDKKKWSKLNYKELRSELISKKFVGDHHRRDIFFDISTKINVKKLNYKNVHKLLTNYNVNNKPKILFDVNSKFQKSQIKKQEKYKNYIIDDIESIQQIDHFVEKWKTINKKKNLIPIPPKTIIPNISASLL